jgi:hypothetical protein
MKHEIHVQFYESINTLVVQTGIIEALKAEALYILFKQALDNELKALDVIIKSELTAVILEKDRERDSIFRGFSDIVKGLRNHFDHEMRKDANKLWNIFLHYGNVTQKSLDAETAAINDIIREFRRAEIAVIIEALQLKMWVEKLEEVNGGFHSLMMERYSEPIGKTSFRMKTARLETDKYYRAMITHFENMALTGQMNSDDDFFVQLNNIIRRFKNILAQELGKRKASNAESVEKSEPVSQDN